MCGKIFPLKRMTSNHEFAFLDTNLGITVFKFPTEDSYGVASSINYMPIIDMMSAGTYHLLIISGGRPHFILISDNQIIENYYSGSDIVRINFSGAKGYLVDNQGIIHYFRAQEEDHVITFLPASNYEDISTFFECAPELKKKPLKSLRKESRLKILNWKSKKKVIFDDFFSVIVKKNKLIFNGDVIYKENEENSCGLILNNIVLTSGSNRGLMILDSANNIYSYGVNIGKRLGIKGGGHNIDKLVQVNDMISSTVIHMKLERNFSIIIVQENGKYEIKFSGILGKFSSDVFQHVTMIDA